MFKRVRLLFLICSVFVLNICIGCLASAEDISEPGLEKALANPGGDEDLVLREYDNLFVPEYNGTVKVGGEVMLPNTLTYYSGKSYKWYINQSGGFSKRARKRNAYIVYQNGTSQLVKNGAEVEPGCEIVIPAKEQKEPAKWSDFVALGTTMASMAALVASIVRLIN